MYCRVEGNGSQVYNTLNQNLSMAHFEINHRTGQVRIGGEIPTFEDLRANLEWVETIKTQGDADIDLFAYKGGFIEYMGDSSFGSGEDVNFTDLSLEEIRDYYSN